MSSAKRNVEVELCEEFFERLIKESRFVPGDDGELLVGNQIEWLNSELVKEGQTFVKRNSFSVNLAHVVSLLVGFSFKNLTTILLRTGKFSDVSNSMIRFIETEMHILDWYESDILAEGDKGFHDLQIVRKMHARALKLCYSGETPLVLFEDVPGKLKKEELINALEKDLQCFVTSEIPSDLLTYHPTVFMSQFDMAMTQFGFVGFVYLFPEYLGIKDTKGMNGFLHLWAVIGRLIGVQDRFNLALHANKELFMKIFKTIGMANLKNTDLTAVLLQENFTTAIAQLFRLPPLNYLLYFGLKGAKRINAAYNGKNTYKILSWKNVFYLRLLEFLVFLVYHFDCVREGINRRMRTVISIINKREYFGNRL